MYQKPCFITENSFQNPNVKTAVVTFERRNSDVLRNVAVKPWDAVSLERWSRADVLFAVPREAGAGASRPNEDLGVPLPAREG